MPNIWSLTLYLALMTPFLGVAKDSKPVFRFHLFTEPQHLDPHTTSSASGNQVFHSLYRGLYSYRSDRGLKLEGAQSCRVKRLKMTCKLKTSHRWSDGSRIRATDYVRSFRRLIDPAYSSPQADVLFTLENAKEIWAGKKKPETLGIRELNEFTIEFSFAEADREFEYKLIHPALSPDPPLGYPAREKAQELITSGPYRIKDWKKSHSIVMEPNPFFESDHARPLLEALFLDEDSTALRLFEGGKLNFVRRLVATEIPKWRGRPEFHQVTMARFDYLGFSQELPKNLREALATGVEHKRFLELFDTRTPPGCPSLPKSHYGKIECLRFNPKAGDLIEDPKAKLELFFSRMGGDDIARAAEWFQAQWKTHLGLEVQLKSLEQTSYLSRLKTAPPSIFRKGVSLDRPTCLAGLEIFSKGHPENYIRLDDPVYEKLLQRLRGTVNKAERQRACRAALEYLMKTHRLVFLGEMYFTVLADTRFTGWHLNELNQLDLSQLRFHPHP